MGMSEQADQLKERTFRFAQLAERALTPTSRRASALSPKKPTRAPTGWLS